MPKTDLIDKKRDANVYEAVDNNIFDPKIRKLLYEDTGLGKILEHHEKDKSEVQMLKAIFRSVEHDQINRIVMPSVYQGLREAYQIGRVDIFKVFGEVKKDISGYLHEAIRMRDDKETKEFYDNKQAKFQTELRKKLEDVLNTLTYRERESVKLRYGLGNGYIHTIDEVGKIFQVSRERARQIEAKAIRKLQYPIRARMLKGFLEGYEEDKPSVYSLREMTNYTSEQRDLILKSPVSDFELSVRTQNILKNMGVKTIGDLCNFSELDLLAYRNCGFNTLEEIKNNLLRPYRLDLKQKTPKENS